MPFLPPNQQRQSTEGNNQSMWADQKSEQSGQKIEGVERWAGVAKCSGAGAVHGSLLWSKLPVASYSCCLCSFISGKKSCYKYWNLSYNMTILYWQISVTLVCILYNETVSYNIYTHLLCIDINYYYYYLLIINYINCLQCFDILVGCQEKHPACKNWVMRCWCGYRSGARCWLFAYFPAYATASQNPIIFCLI